METEILEKKLTPMMEQWHACKKTAKEALLLFRLGDFYEAFHEDAEIIARELDLTLTQRQGIPMSGIPWHTSDGYVDRLMAKGYRVAIAEQIEDPKTVKGLVKRAVTRLITPGTVVQSSLLTEKTNNYLSSLTQIGSIFAIASIDVTTGEFKVTEMESERDVLNELCRLHPRECLVSTKFKEKQTSLLTELDSLFHPLIATLDPWAFDHQMAYRCLTSHFQVMHLDGFGLKGMVAAINAAGALLTYLKEELSLGLEQILTIRPYSTKEILLIDRISQRNLELTESIAGHKKETLLGHVDYTLTPMGGRLLLQWVKAPLVSIQEIHYRQEAIKAFIAVSNAHESFRSSLRGVRDIERLSAKITSNMASPRDLVALRESLIHLTPLKNTLEKVDAQLINKWRNDLIDMTSLIDLLKKALVDEPPARIQEGGAIRLGFHAELDSIRNLSTSGKEWIARYQQRIREEFGLKTAKVGFNHVFGYYIEISKGQANQVPDSFQRRQTMANAERFITPELKNYEEKVLSAEEKSLAIELSIFSSLKEAVSLQIPSLQKIGRALANLDALQSLADLARRHGYVCPVIDPSHRLEIVEGRHPIVEALLPRGSFIPNDTVLDGNEERMMLITGPNMAGKSTYIRQVALIVILAQMGSFVPAKQAHIGIIDHIFTRIGANDDLSRGQSTFMVEMSETAHILNNATSRSLVILDEIGRGTSTYDGVSIAWAVAEYLLTTEGKKAKTLFATHYWELTELEQAQSGAINYHAAVQEWNDEIVFLHKIHKGGADRSYGIHVAKLAGLPFPVIAKAQQILLQFENGGGKPGKCLGKKEENKAKEKQLLLW